MPTNLELKARCSSPAKALRIARALNARRVGILKQKDTYFKVPSGRLKVREMSGKKSDLIYYNRDNTRASRYSDYRVIPLKAPKAVKRLLASLFGVLMVVNKGRSLYLYKNARIHFDTVRGLGSFIEFEVLVTKGKAQARRLMNELVSAFTVTPRSMTGFSYSDLLLQQRRK